MQIQNKEISITNGFIKRASLVEERFEDVENPELIIKELKELKNKPDIFTFIQRLPDLEPKYNYFMEKESIAAIKITTFDDWWMNKVKKVLRRRVRKSQQLGVEVRSANFDDEFIKGMVSIFNETPIRQGRHFWHFGKDFETIKEEFSKFLFREEQIGAYYGGELIGFVFLTHADRYTILMQFISKIEYRKLSTNNALMAKVVEVCVDKKIPYLIYGKWGRSTFAEFKDNFGFDRYDIPRYFIPLTVKGKILLMLHLHNGIKNLLPNIIFDFLFYLRKKYYSFKY